MSCDRLWEIDAVREGRLSSSDLAASQRHRQTCATCRARFDADERLAELGRALPVPPPDPLGERRLRARILRSAATPALPSSRWRIAIPVFAFAIALVVFGLRKHPPEVLAVSPPAAVVVEEFASTVVPGADARWSRRRDGDIEHVTLESGTISLQVRKQRPNERFFVDLPDGLIEVRGTRFAVVVTDTHVESIVVTEGVIAFTRPDHDEIVLRAGEQWRREKPVAIAPPKPVRRIDTTAADYEAAMSAYRAHSYNDASERFARFLREHPNAAQIEDAMFLQASSAAYAGQREDAAQLAKRFLEKYPDSFHARDAAILVARGAP